MIPISANDLDTTRVLVKRIGRIEWMQSYARELSENWTYTLKPDFDFGPTVLSEAKRPGYWVGMSVMRRSRCRMLCPNEVPAARWVPVDAQSLRVHRKVFPLGLVVTPMLKTDSSLHDSYVAVRVETYEVVSTWAVYSLPKAAGPGNKRPGKVLRIRMLQHLKERSMLMAMKQDVRSVHHCSWNEHSRVRECRRLIAFEDCTMACEVRLCSAAEQRPKKAAFISLALPFRFNVWG